MKHFLLPTAVLLTTLANAAAAACSVEKAVYELQPDPAITLKFANVKFDSTVRTAVNLHLTASGASHSFLIEQGNGMYSYAHFLPLARAAGSETGGNKVKLANFDLAFTMDFFMLTSDHKVMSHIPKLQDDAPAYIFIPGLAPNLWYQSDKFGKSNTRERIPLGLFIRKCLT